MIKNKAEEMIRFQLVGADLPKLITSINNMRITLYDILQVDSLTLQASVAKRNYDNLSIIAKKSGSSIKIISTSGLFFKIKCLKNRPILFLIIFTLCVLTVALPSRILFIKIDGNRMIPNKLILSQAEICGIKFGADRNKVRSEKVKNFMMETIPQLQWIGVNTTGCVATISVKEKVPVYKQEKNNY